MRFRYAVLIVSAVVFGACSGSEPLSVPRRTDSEAVARGSRRGIVVESQIVKQTGGKHRYYFDVRNHDATPFSGSVTITLFGDSGPLAKETFTTREPVEPQLGTSVYLDANTGPVSVHGSAGMKTFKYEVVEGGHVVASGTGTITTRFESL